MQGCFTNFTADFSQRGEGSKGCSGIKKNQGLGFRVPVKDSNQIVLIKALLQERPFPLIKPTGTLRLKGASWVLQSCGTVMLSGIYMS